MSKKKKNKKSQIKLIIELLIALGTFLAGLASLIQALK
jgi:Na+/serine symporter